MRIKQILLNMKKWGWTVVIGMAVLAIIAYVLPEQILGPRVSGFEVTQGELIQTVTVSGNVAPPPVVNVSSPVRGKIVSVAVNVGQAIQTGQILMVVDSRVERVEIQNASLASKQAAARLQKIKALTQAGSEQSLKKAQATLDTAQQHYSRSKTLAGKGFISVSQGDEALHNLAIAQSQLATAQFQSREHRGRGSDYALAEAAYNKARANEHRLREKSAPHIVKAEKDGIVYSCEIAPGNSVLPDMTLMTISAAGTMKLHSQIDEKFIPNLHLGMAASLSVEGNSTQQTRVVLSKMTAVAESASNMAEIQFDVPHPPDYLRPGMAAAVEIAISRRANTLSIATQAIRDPDGVAPWVMVAANGRAQRRAVTPGLRGKFSIEILAGLTAGELVLPVTSTEVLEGKRIRLVSRE